MPVTRPDPLAPLIAAPTETAVLSDFDGSLAAIVDDPAEAAPVPGALAALAALVPLVGRVGVVSGRPVSFLRRVLRVEGVALAGLYGMERLVDGEIVVDPKVEPWLGAADAAAFEAEKALPGLYVERKGAISCVIHWRKSPGAEGEAMSLGRQIAERHGLAAEPGRMSLELRPPVALDKGTAVEGLAAGLALVMFAGDDRGDLSAFDALDRMVGDHRLRDGIKIAVRSAEAPPELLDRADERVDGPEELVSLLRALADAVG